jgi:hypothetical protein
VRSVNRGLSLASRTRESHSGDGVNGERRAQ